MGNLYAPAQPTFGRRLGSLRLGSADLRVRVSELGSGSSGCGFMRGGRSLGLGFDVLREKVFGFWCLGILRSRLKG